MIPSSEKANITQKVLEQVNFADKTIFYLERNEAGTVDDLTQYASQFIDSLQLHCSDDIKDIQGKVEDNTILETLDFVYDHLPLFLDESDYQRIESRLQQDSIQQITQSHYKTQQTHRHQQKTC